MAAHLSAFGPQFVASEDIWLPADAAHPAGYMLNGVTEPADIDRLPPLHSGDRPLVFTRSESEWLQPRQCFVVSDVTFEQLIGSTNWSQYSSTPELGRAIANPSLGVGAEIPLRVHARFLAPLLDMALVMLGIPLVAGPSRRGVFLAVGLCVLMTVLFFVVILGCHAMAATDVLSPSMAAWAPLLLLAPLAAWRSQPMWQ